MDTSQGWWNNPADVAAGRTAGGQADSGHTPSSQHDDADSLGEQIDRALGDFNDRIISLKEQLQEKRSEIKELEVMIAELEKEQAKAFKGLLSSNPNIKKLLGATKPKSKSTGRRKKKKTTPAPEATAEDDNESLL